MVTALAPGRVLVAAVGWTWAWLAVAAAVARATGGAWLDPAVLVFVVPGLAGPFLVAVAASRHLPRSDRSRLWRGVVDPRGIAPRWWAAVLAVGLAPKLVAFAAGLAAGEVTAGLAVASLGALAGTAGFAVLAGFGEEPLWRGVARGASQARYAPAPAALLVGIAWAAWHLPLYFLPGTYQHGLGFGSAGFGLAAGGQVAAAFLLVWLVNGAGGRVLVAAVAHALGNLAGELLPASTWTAAVEFGLVVAVVVVVVAGTRGRLGREPGGPVLPQPMPGGRARSDPVYPTSDVSVCAPDRA